MSTQTNVKIKYSTSTASPTLADQLAQLLRNAQLQPAGA